MGLNSGWSATATSGADAAVTVVRAAEAGKIHTISGFDVTFDGAAAFVLVEVKDGATVIWSGFVSDTTPMPKIFPHRVRVAVEALVSVTVAAAGVGRVSKVNMDGFTVGD